MPSLRGRVSTLAALAMCLLTVPTHTTRLFERRSDLKIPPVNASDWTLPLQGSKTCRMGGCTDTLTPPASDTTLQVLAVGKGIFNYTCANTPPNSPPTFDAQYTELYNAAPLIPVLPDEETFHSLIPVILGYSYEKMDNSTMECMGSIGTLNGTAIITLFDIDTFELPRSESVLAPEDPDHNAMWVHSHSANGSWEMYRVETYGGRPPAKCEGQPEVLEIEYAAEYWFYKINEGIKT